MPIPDPTTPGDGTDCPPVHSGGTLKTPDLKPFSLSGGEKNEVLFLKSRTGNLVSLDDHGFTLRVQDRTGNAEICLQAGCIEIKQKTGDIDINATKEVRFDCTNFEVHAKKDISMGAGTDVSLTGGNMSVDAGQNATISADQNFDMVCWNTTEFKSMQDMSYSAKKKLSVCTKAGDIKIMAMGKIAVIAKQDLGVISKAMLNMTGLLGCNFKSSDKVTLNASGMIMGMANCININ